MKKILSIAVLWLCVLHVAAQKIMVSGNVTDEFGGIMGCSVAEIDASNRVVGGTTTNMEGNYALAIQNVKNRLRFSYVGFKTEVREIGSNRKINVRLPGQYDCVENNSGDGEETFQRRNVFHSATRGFHGDEHVQSERGGRYFRDFRG